MHCTRTAALCSENLVLGEKCKELKLHSILQELQVISTSLICLSEGFCGLRLSLITMRLEDGAVTAFSKAFVSQT